MDQSTAVLVALTSMLSRNDIEVQQPSTLEEVIEMIKETPTGEISDNLKDNELTEREVQEELKALLKKGKIKDALNSTQPVCGSHCQLRD